MKKVYFAGKMGTPLTNKIPDCRSNYAQKIIPPRVEDQGGEDE